MIMSLEAKKVVGLIVDDIVSGQVPTGLTTFSELHNYVDANTYLLDAMPEVGWMTDEDMAKANGVMEEVNGWLEQHKNYRRRELSKPVI